MYAAYAALVRKTAARKKTPRVCHIIFFARAREVYQYICVCNTKNDIMNDLQWRRKRMNERKIDFFFSRSLFRCTRMLMIVKCTKRRSQERKRDRSEKRQFTIERFRKFLNMQHRTECKTYENETIETACLRRRVTFHYYIEMLFNSDLL